MMPLLLLANVPLPLLHKETVEAKAQVEELLQKVARGGIARRRGGG